MLSFNSRQVPITRAGFLFFAARLGFAKISLALHAPHFLASLKNDSRRVYSWFAGRFSAFCSIFTGMGNMQVNLRHLEVDA